MFCALLLAACCRVLVRSGSITAMCVWQHAIFAGTASGTLLRYDIEMYEGDGDTAARAPAAAASAAAASSLRPPMASSTQFAVVRSSLSCSYDARKHHGKGRGSPFLTLSVCPWIGSLCALSEGQLCLYDMATLAFQQKVSPPNGGSIDRFALFPMAPSTLSLTPKSASFTLLSLCLCVGKRVYILARSMETPADERRAASLTPQQQQQALAQAAQAQLWQPRQELFIPEPANCVTWIDAVHILIGFRKEYTIINTVTGDGSPNRHRTERAARWRERWLTLIAVIVWLVHLLARSGGSVHRRLR